MLGNPTESISFNSPSSTNDHRIKCSFCAYESWATPVRTKSKDIPLWKSHTCDFTCDSVTCLKPYINSGGSEFYVADNKFLMCHNCNRLDGSQTYHLRPFNKLPESSEFNSKPSIRTTTKIKKPHKDQDPNHFESKARLVNSIARACQSFFSAIMKPRSRAMFHLKVDRSKLS